MKKSSIVNEESAEQRDAKAVVLEPSANAEAPAEALSAEAAAAADRAVRLQAAQDKAAQLMREQRYDEARRVLKDAETLRAQDAPIEPVAEVDLASKLAAAQEKVTQLMREQKFEEARRAVKEVEVLQAEETNVQRLVEAKAEREKAALLASEGKYAEAQASLDRADELEVMVEGWKGRPKRFFASIRSRLPERSKGEPKPQAEIVEPVATDPLAVPEPVADSMRIVGLHAKVAAAVGLLPGGLLNFAAILPVQVLMVWRIARKFDQKVGKEQIRGVVVSLFTSVVPGIVGHGAGVAIASIPAAIAGMVVYFVATPILAYALTHAVGNVFIMHFESGGTLLTFDPKAFTEYFVNEFKKAGGTLRQTDEPAPEASATPA